MGQEVKYLNIYVIVIFALTGRQRQTLPLVSMYLVKLEKQDYENT